MQNDKTTPRNQDRDLRAVNYRPLGPGQDFKRSLSPAPTRPASPAVAPVNPITPPSPTTPAVVPPAAPAVAAPNPKPLEPTPPPIPDNSATEEVKEKKRRRFSFGRTMTVLAVFGILGITGYVSYDTLNTNSEVKEVVAQTSSEDTSVLGEGTDETEVSANVIDSYKVSADMPRVLSIESLGIRSRILPMSVTNTGAIQAPTNIFDSGWYTGSAKPGTSGAGLIDAHASGATREGLFAYLDKLKEGDKISVERGNGEILNYAVVHVETVDLSTIDMTKALETYGDVKEGINLITCSGTWMPDEATYDKRVLVYTERI